MQSLAFDCRQCHSASSRYVRPLALAFDCRQRHSASADSIAPVGETAIESDESELHWQCNHCDSDSALAGRTGAFPESARRFHLLSVLWCGDVIAGDGPRGRRSAGTTVVETTTSRAAGGSGDDTLAAAAAGAAVLGLVGELGMARRGRVLRSECTRLRASSTHQHLHRKV